MAEGLPFLISPATLFVAAECGYISEEKAKLTHLYEPALDTDVAQTGPFFDPGFSGADEARTLMKKELSIRKHPANVRNYGIWVFALAAVILLFVFMRLTREMLEGETRQFDEMILLGLRQASDLAIPVGPSWLTKMMTDLTALGGTTVLGLISVLAVLFLWLRGARRTSGFLAASLLGGWILSTLLKIGVARPRPELVAHLVVVNDFSFPSGHAMLSAVTYMTLGALLSRTERRRSLKLFFVLTALVLVIVIGCSRVFLGVHYPSDVVGGWTAGAAWASFCWLISHWVLLPSKAEPPVSDTVGDDLEGHPIRGSE